MMIDCKFKVSKGKYGCNKLARLSDVMLGEFSIFRVCLRCSN